MNPIGIGIGWILADEGPRVTAIFESISAGTFLFIATQEIINREFISHHLLKRKICLFIVAIGFVVMIWFMELWLGG
jgi:zinc transporter 1/2/3